MSRTSQPAEGSATPRRTVLVSGASIAGPTLAYWLNRYGYAVTVVERAGAPRSGGYPIDVRGTAIEVLRRMGLLPRLRDAHIDLRRLTFLGGDGQQVASLHPHSVTGGVTGNDLEVPRGELTAALYEAVRDDVEFLFDDSIATIDQAGDGAEVTFHGGGRRRFDMVFAADGMHSRTREMVFGPEARFHHYLGYCFAVFTMRNTLGLDSETVMWNTPGRAAALYAVGGQREVHAFLTFARPEPPFDAFPTRAAQTGLISEIFADAGWEIPGMLAALRDADDVFFDAVAQIRMPRWSSGRVAVLGDAAYAPSFLTGQGTSLALVGAYMLAGSLADQDHATGFAAYERATREFVTLNQALAGAGGGTLFPATPEALEQRNDRLRRLSAMPSPPPRPAHTALTLPDFEAPARR
ncbi:FAD-dependent monooxygenase [Catenuloplanes atrovinosus]|uniref:2-polyprenyl-6-methoxyphenol hydroxylase-like FAD-dependent oxidoreductase n=1 Tax=Catenuloplanes atrovinosus TaxID=137266 RepID=A0AAE4CBS3_9ACTN|nr:FAD-dependent monooxygenase [Catenuloplanes atrovinosus]MDR7277244.1 2-polyprenyl-6-methoxyphenol hydroxylase-like FAD-dependent oxidoreductase [Catenuloplanes atrovinosus]